MDNALRAEFRAWKTEIEDRVKALERTAQAVSVDEATTTSKKSKAASVASVSEPDTAKSDG